MRKVEMPELQFSKWFAWDQRHMIPLADQPGVYVISIVSDENLIERPFSWDRASYIGMTTSKGGLSQRLNLFDGALNGGRGHSGGKRVVDDLGERDTWQGVAIFVAVLPIICSVEFPAAGDYRTMGQVAYLEYEAFAEFSQLDGTGRGVPKYNKKGASTKR